MNTAFWLGVALQLICAGALVGLVVWAVCSGKDAAPGVVEKSKRKDVDPWGGE